jgi:hypothetical protein
MSKELDTLFKACDDQERRWFEFFVRNAERSHLSVSARASGSTPRTSVNGLLKWISYKHVYRDEPGAINASFRLRFLRPILANPQGTESVC